MATSHLRPLAPPPSGRYLTFTDRDQTAIWHAQGQGVSLEQGAHELLVTL